VRNAARLGFSLHHNHFERPKTRRAPGYRRHQDGGVRTEPEGDCAASGSADERADRFDRMRLASARPMALQDLRRQRHGGVGKALGNGYAVTAVLGGATSHARTPRPGPSGFGGWPRFLRLWAASNPGETITAPADITRWQALGKYGTPLSTAVLEDRLQHQGPTRLQDADTQEMLEGYLAGSSVPKSSMRISKRSTRCSR
jgi:hypothetical protein